MTSERAPQLQPSVSRSLPQPAGPESRALQPVPARSLVPQLRAVARRALPAAVRVATAAVATLAAERALARAVTRVLPAEAASNSLAGRRRIVVTERVQIDRYRIRR